MKVSMVRVELNRAIRVDDFKYYKVGIAIETQIEEGETVQTAMEVTKGMAKRELQTLIDEEKKHYKNQAMIVKYEKMLKQYASGSTEHILAQEKLDVLRDAANQSV